MFKFAPDRSKVLPLLWQKWEGGEGRDGGVYVHLLPHPAWNQIPYLKKRILVLVVLVVVLVVLVHHHRYHYHLLESE